MSTVAPKRDSIAVAKKDAARQPSKATFDVPARSKSRLVSSISLSYAARQSVAWRSSGQGGFKVPKYQNTFRLEPYLRFHCEVSDKILAACMNEALQGQGYNPETSSDLCRNLAADVRDRLYRTDYDRVKYVVTMTIVENTGQSVVSVNGRLWDAERDTYSFYVFESPTFYAAGMVMALYYE
ncbi:tctex1 domain-containing protein A isoform X1 [Nasonia vitripennis]|uniref:Uncharacterized protein n=1 Tax=Nasonia vitripennis TaxID=7425 RepID=A0A7M7HA21_NASVI|nr:tctex1 domain-containing protein A isoform X1 [Nasonia vitripennis]